ncbi:hypothetical protein ScPMuIL_012581 [Solemya velum]
MLSLPSKSYVSLVEPFNARLRFADSKVACCLVMYAISIDINYQDGTIVCPKSQRCINTTLKCNQVNDCEDGYDEKFCRDPDQDATWNGIFPKRPDADRHEERDLCSLSYVPEFCECKEMTRLYCTRAQLTDWPTNLPITTTFLDLSLNRIKRISPTSLKKLPNLKELYLQNNIIRHIDPEAFHYNNSIKKLWLSHNRLQELPDGMFQQMSSITALYLSKNQIQTIGNKTFDDNNHLAILFLNENHMVYVNSEMFSKLRNLTNLNLSRNRIKFIEEGSFAALTKLKSLLLANNNLRHIRRSFFDGLDRLKYLDLRGNNIKIIDPDAFQPLSGLTSMQLERNPFRSLPVETIGQMPSLQFVYFDVFYMCIFAPQVKRCEPRGDGISSHANLLESSVLRVSVWIVGILACVGNVIVLMGRSLLREDNQMHSFYIKNLSMADMLMGIYLLIIGSHDVMYRGNYIHHDEGWRNSWQCDTCGIISTISSEVSVLTIALITLDRYISIMYPFYHKRKDMKTAYFVMTCMWIACLAMAIMPVVGLNYFGKTFYRDNGVCIPLQLHRPRTRGWQYSTFLFLGLNLAAFIFISYAYIIMFIAIKKSTELLRSTNNIQETIFVKRFFLIVITDFVCWVPIMVIKIAALAGVKVSVDLYAWLIVFILPVNSALNPLLYTITTKLYRRKLIPSFCFYLHGRKSAEKSSSYTPARPVHAYHRSSYLTPNVGVRYCPNPCIDDHIRIDSEACQDLKFYPTDQPMSIWSTEEKNSQLPKIENNTRKAWYRRIATFGLQQKQRGHTADANIIIPFLKYGCHI